MTTDARYELLAAEKNKKYIVLQTFTIEYKDKKLTITKGFSHDKYTFAPDLPDEIPAIAHDFACVTHKWDDGTSIRFFEAVEMLHTLMLESKDELTRNCANLYCRFVRWFGWITWYL